VLCCIILRVAQYLWPHDNISGLHDNRVMMDWLEYNGRLINEVDVFVSMDLHVDQEEQVG